MKPTFNLKAYTFFLLCYLFFQNTQTSSAQNFPSTFPWINDTVYISGNASNGGNGSINSPFNNWDDFTFNSKTAYLFKRGTTMDIPGKLVVSADSVYLGGYGSGNRPLFNGKGTIKHFVFSGTQQYIQGLNVRCQDTGTCFTFLGDSTKFAWADSLNMSHSWWGTNVGGYGKIILSNIYIHRTRVDGLYSSHNDTIIIRNTRIHDVNRWYEDIKDINSSGGDCIQGESNKFVVIDGCELDHSDMAGKFALIQNGADTVIVKNSTLTGYKESSTVYLGGIKKGWHFDGCKIIGGKIGLWNHGKLLIKNCIFTECTSNAINGDGATILNSTFVNVANKKYREKITGEDIDATTSALNGWGTAGWKVYNCLFYNVDRIFGANDEYVWASHNYYYNGKDINYDGENTADPVEQPQTQWGENIINTIDDTDTTDAPPLLFNPNNGDYEFYLDSNSVLIDVGLDPATINEVVSTDINGNPRPNGNKYDIGAYEYYKDDLPKGNADSDNILLYPNPTTGKIYVKTDSDIFWVKVYDMSGRMIFENSMLSTGDSIDISTLKNNFYIIVIQTQNKVVAKKLLKIGF